MGYCFQLRQSLFHGENNDHDALDNPENNEDDDYDNGNHDFEAPDFDMPETAEHNEDEHLGKEKVSCHLEELMNPYLCRKHIPKLNCSYIHICAAWQ